MQGYFSNNVLQRPTIFQFNSHPFFIIHQIMVGKSFACTDLKHFRRSFSFGFTRPIRAENSTSATRVGQFSLREPKQLRKSVRCCGLPPFLPKTSMRE